MGFWFDWLRLAGAAYLIWLGMEAPALVRRDRGSRAACPRRAAGSSCRAFFVLLGNPKALLWFGAFIPQFVDPSTGDYVGQVVLLGLTAMAAAAMSDGGYAVLDGRARATSCRRSRVRLVIAHRRALPDRRRGVAGAGADALITSAPADSARRTACDGYCAPPSLPTVECFRGRSADSQRERVDFSAIVDRPPLKCRATRADLLDHRQLRGVGHLAADGAAGHSGADRTGAAPRRAELELARIRHAGRRLALLRIVRPPRHQADARRQCPHLRGLPARRRGGQENGWEFMGHAYDQLPIHKNDDQAAMINRSMDVIEKFTGTRPVGWLGPGLTQTLDTPELLAKAGVQYIGDWVYDDEPTVIDHGGSAGHAALHGRIERYPDDDRATS